MLSVRAAREKLDEVTDPDFFRQAVAIEENAEQPRSSMITYLHERLALLS